MSITYDDTSFNIPVWVCVCEGYLYIEETLEELINTLNTEWKLEKHLVG